MTQHLVYSRPPDAPKEYVQDRMMAQVETLSGLLAQDCTHVDICGLRGQCPYSVRPAVFSNTCRHGATCHNFHSTIVSNAG